MYWSPGGFSGRVAVIAVAAVAMLSGPAAAADKAKADLRNVDGKSVGSVELVQTPSGVVHLTAVFDGVPPGDHGFHIHTNGACSPDFKAAGGHYAPHGHAHGVNDAKGPHGGDMPNIHVPADGKLTIEYFLTGVTLAEGEAGSLFKEGGTAFIVHDGTDDYVSQPSGAAGSRIACGVIEKAG